ncbi:hypothetical protein [Microbacterium aurantiacum]|uniref:hypothetical protein n=1 Tax=Microbacterium aurantiacum TaxID=162393 RepID=UPI0034160B31
MQRIAAHARDASAYGRSIARTWVSPEPQANALQNERIIKGASPREYLDRSFDECVAEAESLPSEPIEERDVRDSPVTKLLTGMFPAYGEWLDREAAK